MKKSLLLYGLLICVISGFGQKPKLVLPVGHPQGILQVTGTPDGKYIISRSFNDPNVRLWSTQTGMMITEIKTIKGAVDLIPSADSRYLLIKSGELLIHWDIENNKSDFIITNSLNGVVMSDDDRYIMGNHFKQLFIYQTVDGQKTFEKAMEDTICSFKFIKNNQILVVSKKKNTRKFMFYDILNDSLIHEFELKDLVDWRFDKHKKYDCIISNNSKCIRTFKLNTQDHTIFNEKKRKSMGKSNGIIDYCPVTEKYLIGFPEKSTLQVFYPDTLFSYILKDFKDLTSAIFVNNGNNIAVKTGNNFTLEYYNNTLDFVNMLFSNEVGDFKNVPAPIFYQSNTKRFYAVLDDNIIREFKSDADTCKQIKEYTGKTSGVTDFSCIGDTLFISNGVGRIKEIILNTGSIVDDFKLSDYHINGFDYNNKKGILTSMDENHQISRFDCRQNTLLNSFTYENKIKSFGYFLYPNLDIVGNNLLIGANGFKYSDRSKGQTYYELRDNESLKVIKKMKIEGNCKGVLRLNKFGNEIICCNQSNSTVSIRNLEFKTLRVLKINNLVMGAIQSKTGKYLIISTDSTIRLYDYKTCNLLHQFPSLLDNDVDFDISPNDSLLVFNSERGSIEVWEVKSGKKRGPFIVHEASLVTPFFIDNNRFATISEDGYLKYWKINKENIEQIFSMVPFQNKDYAVLIPSGYYNCTPNAAKLMHYITDGIKVITFEQLDVKYNRPDKVLEAIGCSDTALINSYRKAYYKRIKKLGIDTTSFRGGYSVPISDFENREAVEFEQKSEKLSLHIKGADSSYKLDRFNIWVNEIPLFGQKGFNIKKRKWNNLDTTITISLSQGENRIETSVLNVNGTESYRMPLSVNYSPEIKLKEKLHFIGIGIDKFSDTSYNLQYSVKDIRDLSKKLKQKFGDEIIIDTLFNEDVTISNVKALKKKLLQTSIDDKVIISYSGHGLLSKDYDYYLSTYSVNFEKPEINGLPYDELENLLDSIPARKKLMLIDACHSGEVDKDEEFAMNNTADSMGLSKPKGGKTINNKSQKQLGLKNSFELMQSLFVNVGKSTGATIISAAAGNQFALEKGDLKNGVFTYCIIEAMNTNSTMTVSQLKAVVGKRVVEITNGLQKPTSRNETINSDWSVW